MYSSYYSTPYTTTASTAASTANVEGIVATILGLGILFWLVCIAVIVLILVARWKVFKKANVDGWEALIGLFYDRFMRIALPAAAIYTLFVLWVGKGSLVESVVIDYPQREIRVTHYRLPSTLCERKLSFDGLKWDVLNGGRGWDRLRLKPKEGKKVVICMMHLGWKFDDCWALMDALSLITPKDK